MTLVVHSKNYNPLRTTRFRPEILKIAKAKGLKNIGVVWVNMDDPQRWECHKCEAKHSKNGLIFNEGHKDILSECGNCTYPFLIIKA